MNGLLSAEDRALIEHTRMVNKTLSMFVLAIQEQHNVSAAVHLELVGLLQALAEAIRTRAPQDVTNHAIAVSGDASLPLAIGAALETGSGP